MKFINFFIIMVGLSILDVYCTHYTMTKFNSNELNPLMNNIIETYGFTVFFIFKLIGVLLIYCFSQMDTEYKDYYLVLGILGYGFPVMCYLTQILTILAFLVIFNT